ncbi:hypothetical protein HRU87_02035 [Aquiluna borgnonia]|uniref:DUF3052 domain-containing protein n=1 Tax=Aquiluna borgnonia TaxID=2499157 RepID=A0A7D4PWY8_9MICO|nr:hypothetical protein [Aquiluna borgnonia]QKJ25004.1 hypothetical protein HRU87_02035 [Aquiluna borgnonia]
MSLAAKMYIPGDIQVPCVNLPTDIDLQDIHPWAASVETARQMVQDGKSPALFYFVENSAQLARNAEELLSLWESKVNFWLFYPKAPHLGTDLSRDKTWQQLGKLGPKGTRQVGIDDRWSCLYYKNSGK